MVFWALLSTAWAGQTQVLMLGNSYTDRNSLHLVVAELFEAAGETPVTEALADGGLTFVDHAERAQTDGTDWNEALVTGDTAWSWVVLQEQSQIPGFPESTDYWQESLQSAGTLDGLTADLGAGTVFLMTWGRREGDSTNASRYPDFPTMQDKLAEGYLRYVSTLSTDSRPVWVAPAGLAFAAIYEDLVAEGSDPLEDGSLFTQLYSSDGSHPSLAGSYLTACVVFSTLTGQSTVGLADALDLEDELRLSLQQAASSTVLEGSAGITYPWTVSDTGTQTDTDSTTDDTSSEDTSSEDDKGTSDAGAASSACGCTTTPVVPTTLAWLGLLGGLAAKRRAGSGVQVSPCGPPGDAEAHTPR